MRRTAHGALAGLARDEQGAAMVEYAIVTAVIAIVALTAAQALGTELVALFNQITAALRGI